MADNISNEYNMVKILKDIGGNFFSKDLSEQRIGMFGFTCEAMARLFGATILDSNMRANEYHTITAKKIDTLLHDAAILGVDVESTNPSTMIAYIAFDVSLIKRSEFTNPGNDNTYYFIIERDTNINIAGYNFMLEWDILVVATYDGTKWIYSARYLSEGDKDPHSNDMCKGGVYIKEDTLSTLNDKYIQGNLIKAGNDSLFMMKVSLRQMEKKYEYHIVTQDDLISLTGIEFAYDDYLSHFNVYYRGKQSDPWEYVLPVTLYDTSEYAEKTVQYEIDRESKIIIINATQFDVKYNSEFRIDIYTTKGASGNITYSGDGSDIVCELKSYDDKHIYNGIDLVCMPITSAMYGTDSATLEDIRGKVIRAKASKNSLSTEYDLYNFMKDKDLINDYFFIKKRSDILEHIYGTFTVLRTETGDIIPTNTLNLLIKQKSDSSNGIYFDPDGGMLTIKAGTAFTPVRNLQDGTEDNAFITESEATLLDIYRTEFRNNSNLSADEFDITDNFLATTFNRVTSSNSIMTNEDICAKEKDMKLFGLPYTMAYNATNQLSSLYMTSISKSVNMSLIEPPNNEYDILEDTSNFVIDHINISRNSFLGEDSYTIEVSVMANADYSNCIIGDYVNSGLSENALMIKGFVYHKDTSDMTSDTGVEVPFAFFDFDFVSFADGIFNFKTTMKVEDSLIVNENSIKIKSPNFMYSIDGPMNVLQDMQNPNTVVGNAHLSNVVPDEYVPIDVFSMKIGIGIYYLSEPVDERTNVPAIVLDDENKFLENAYGYPEFVNGSDADEIPYILTNLYINSSDTIDLYTDMSYVVRATTDTVTIGEDTYIFFRDIPLLQYSKSVDSVISKRVTSIITNTKEYLDEINMRLDNSFSLDYKFFRTYGPCQYFELEKASSEERRSLENLDITLELDARIKQGITATDSDIISKLKTFLKSYIEKLNEEEDDDYSIYISNVTTELENNFSDILRSIDLVNLNGQGDTYRVIYYDKPDLDSRLKNSNNREIIKNYVPEYINLPLENITINIIRYN